MSAYGWMQADARRRELDRVNADGRADRARIVELESQLTDAKRNEERAVELRSDVASLKAELKKTRAERNHESMRKLDAVQVADAMRVTMDAATAKLHTLEAAVRDVRDGHSLDRGTSLSNLYAQVPDGSEGGDS